MRQNKFFIILDKIKELLKRKKLTSAEKSLQMMKNFSRNGVKDCFTGNDSLSIKGKQTLLKNEINKEARSVIKEAMENPDVIAKFIKSKGTLIVKSRYMDKILALIGEEPGFVTPMTGLRALFFTLMTNICCDVKLKIGGKTPEIFAFNLEPVDIYSFSHQFHLWLSYQNRLPGFEEKTIKNFKNFWQSQSTAYFSIEEIMALKDIIARETEAVDFVTEIAREFIGQKNSLQKLIDGDSVSI